jgi:hypothetical protein
MARRRLTFTAAVCGSALVAAAVAACGPAGADHLGANTSAPASSRSASPTATATTAAQALADGQQGSLEQVPWAQVGPGWILAEWSPSLSGSEATSLFLLDPAGGRYLIDTLPANPTASAPTILVGWSGDGERALLTSGGASPTVAVLDLRTLTTTEFKLTDASAAGFTAPDGFAVIANQNNSSTPVLERFSLTGQLELSYPTSFPGNGGTYDGSALYSPDGTELAVGTSTGIELMSNAGQGLRFLPVAPSLEFCSALRWWTPGELLVGCVPDGSGMDQLWLVPTSGATPTALTAAPPAPPDLGDADAWQVPSGTYVQDEGACSYTYIAKLQPDGLTTPVAVPGVPDGESVIIIGTQGNRLAIRNEPGSPETCAHGSTLMWFTPATNSVTPVLGGAANGGTIDSAIMFGEP